MAGGRYLLREMYHKLIKLTCLLGEPLKEMLDIVFPKCSCYGMNFTGSDASPIRWALQYISDGFRSNGPVK